MLAKYSIFRNYETKNEPESVHYVKSVQIWSFFWSVFSCIQTEFGHFSCSGDNSEFLSVAKVFLKGYKFKR